mgnify:CR=1 FL=1
MALKKIDRIVRWREFGRNKFGESSFEDPVEIEVRWNDSGRETTDEEGIQFIPMATIYDDVKDNIKPGDRVLRKLLADLEADDIDKSSIVRSAKESRNGSGTRFLYTSYTSSVR